MTTKVLVRKVALILDERHWSHEQFAKLVGVSRQRVHWLLTYGKKPDPLTVQRFAKELHLRMADIVDEQGYWLMVEQDA